MNPWPWFFLILLPMFVVSVKPGAPGWLYIGRLLAAILVGYVLLNLMIHTHHRLKFQAYELCAGDYREGDPAGYEICHGDSVIADGASNIFYLYFGWIPAYGYVGLWEWIWRKKHLAHIKKIGVYEGLGFSFLLTILSIPVLIYELILLIGFFQLQLLHFIK